VKNVYKLGWVLSYPLLPTTWSNGIVRYFKHSYYYYYPGYSFTYWSSSPLSIFYRIRWTPFYSIYYTYYRYVPWDTIYTQDYFDLISGDETADDDKPGVEDELGDLLDYDNLEDNEKKLETDNKLMKELGSKLMDDEVDKVDDLEKDFKKNNIETAMEDTS